jgi:hypothetical protein
MESNVTNAILSVINGNNAFEIYLNSGHHIDVCRSTILLHNKKIHDLANICNENYDHIFNVIMIINADINEKFHFNGRCVFNKLVEINAKFYAKIINVKFCNEFINFNNCYADCFIMYSYVINEYNARKLFYLQNITRLYFDSNGIKISVKNGKLFKGSKEIVVLPNIEFLALNIQDELKQIISIVDMNNSRKFIFEDYLKFIEHENHCEYYIKNSHETVIFHPFVNLVENSLCYKNANF